MSGHLSEHVRTPASRSHVATGRVANAIGSGTRWRNASGPAAAVNRRAWLRNGAPSFAKARPGSVQKRRRRIRSSHHRRCPGVQPPLSFRFCFLSRVAPPRFGAALRRRSFVAFRLLRAHVCFPVSRSRLARGSGEINQQTKNVQSCENAGCKSLHGPPRT